MPEFILPMGPCGALEAFDAADDFTQGYIEAMFFTSTGPDNEEEQLGPDTYVGELSIEAWRKIKQDCTAFMASSAYVAAMGDNGSLYTGQDGEGYDFDEDQAGRDFWYTRNGHGVGFWDRDEDVYGPHADALSEAARKFGEVDLYRGDDGKLYL